MNNAIIFIAGGPWQKPFVQYLKNKGHYIAVVNPVQTPTTDLADFHIVADVNNLDIINHHIQNIKPRFITSDQSDISTLTVARLSTQWGLPGNDVKVVQRFTDKYFIVDFASQIGISVPETSLVDSEEDVCRFADTYGYPIIVKPTDATNSRGFRKIDTKIQTTEALAIAKQFSKSKKVIAQRFIPGTMIVLDGVCSGGKHKTISSARKDEYFKPGINTGIRYPSQLKSTLLNRIITWNDHYVEQAGMRFGLTHSEYIVDGDDVYLIEIGGRGGGAGITDKIVPWVSGVKVYDILYQSLMGEVVDVKSIIPLLRPALLQYYDEQEFSNGFNEIKQKKLINTPGVADFQYNFIGKQYVSDNYDNRHSFSILLSNDDQGLNELSAYVYATIHDDNHGR